MKPLNLFALGVVTLGGIAAATGCGDRSMDTRSSGPSGADTGSFSDAGEWNAADAGAPADTSPQDRGPDLPPPPPEVETDFDLRTPEAGARFLYIPSAGLDALVVVDAQTLQVHLVEVGARPTLVRALPTEAGSDADAGAVVLNEGTADISVVRPAVMASGEVVFDVFNVNIMPGHNRMTVSPDGQWAFAWYDHRRAGEESAFGSLQDVSAVRLVEGAEAMHNLSVGFKPEDVVFSDGGALALFICEAGISGIRLEALKNDVFLPPVRLNDDPFHVAMDREIVVVPDGSLAVVRDLSEAGLTLVDLQSQARTFLPLGDWPSDLELTPDGATVIVPMIETQAVALIQVPEAFEVGADVVAAMAQDGPEANPYVAVRDTGARFGAASLTAGGERAILYTTIPGTQAIGMVDLITAEAWVQPLVKETTDVLVSPDGTMAALLHRRDSGAAAEVAGRDAYSLLDLQSGYVKTEFVEAPANRFIFTADSSELFVLIPDPRGSHAVHQVSTASFAVTPYSTPDPPIFVGAMPRVNKVAIALDNPTGWITFVDTDSGDIEQVNSFELNAFIR